MDRIDIRIRRLVWHGAARPDSAALAEAIASALAQGTGAAAAGPGAASPLAACAMTVAREIAPRLAAAEASQHG